MPLQVLCPSFIPAQRPIHPWSVSEYSEFACFDHYLLLVDNHEFRWGEDCAFHHNHTFLLGPQEGQRPQGLCRSYPKCPALRHCHPEYGIGRPPRFTQRAVPAADVIRTELQPSSPFRALCSRSTISGVGGRSAINWFG